MTKKLYKIKHSENDSTFKFDSLEGLNQLADDWNMSAADILDSYTFDEVVGKWLIIERGHLSINE